MLEHWTIWTLHKGKSSPNALLLIEIIFWIFLCLFIYISIYFSISFCVGLNPQKVHDLTDSFIIMKLNVGVQGCVFPVLCCPACFSCCFPAHSSSPRRLFELWSAEPDSWVFCSPGGLRLSPLCLLQSIKLIWTFYHCVLLLGLQDNPLVMLNEGSKPNPSKILIAH